MSSPEIIGGPEGLDLSVLLDDPCSMAGNLIAGTAYPVTMLALTSCTLVTGVVVFLYLVFRQWRSNRLFGRSWSRQTVNVFSPTATGNKVRIPSDFSITRKSLVSQLYVQLADFLNSVLASRFPQIHFLTLTPRLSINQVQPLPSTIYPKSPIHRSNGSQPPHGYSLLAPHTLILQLLISRLQAARYRKAPVMHLMQRLTLTSTRAHRRIR